MSGALFVMAVGAGMAILFRKEPFMRGLGLFVAGLSALHALLLLLAQPENKLYEDMSKEELIRTLEGRDEEQESRWENYDGR